ncbi:MAG: metallophosphoesterase [Gemmataceae bacterium]
MELVLAAVGVLGHLVLLVGTHNYLYGQPFPKWASKLVHLGHLLAFLALPVGLWLGWGLWLDNLFAWPPTCVTHALVLSYLAVCAVFALIVLPSLTLARALHRDAASQRRVEIVHVPCRRSRHWLAALPGNEIYSVAYQSLSIRLPRLPAALEGLTILHLTDLHFHGIPDRDYFEALVAHCNQWQPDIIALTGDVVDSDDHHRWILPLLGRLQAKLARYAILGNHDFRHEPERVRRRLRRIGFQVLNNTTQTLFVCNTPLHIIGHEGPWLLPAPDLSTLPPDGLRLCLSHTPDNAEWGLRHCIDLMLCGHVHGGQIRLPFIGPVFMPSVYGRRFDQGVFALGEMRLVVSRGVSGEHPVRYRCRPEVSLLTLQPAEHSRTPHEPLNPQGQFKP